MSTLKHNKTEMKILSGSGHNVTIYKQSGKRSVKKCPIASN